MEDLVPASLIQALKKQKYHRVVKHSAVKRCKWFYEALTSGRSCYKQKFYGIKSHQCIQMSPAMFYCTQQCLFCWRAQNGDLQIRWDEMKLPQWDPPQEIAQGILEEQNRILGGYKGHPRINMENFREAFTPKHVAISLTGEPTLYAPLGELIRTLHSRGLTTFLVSNGTLPQKLSQLSEEPTQMYVSVCAPNQKTYDRVCRPQLPNLWEKVNETLEFMPSFKCPTVIRTTLVKNLNMQDIAGYAKLVDKANPTYIEAKAYMHVGFSGLRLGFDNMPKHKDVYEFASQLAKETGYKLIDEAPDSRVVLLSKQEKPTRFSSS
ncbi:MAG: 4-demethylwyosine synthase TYW1 [Candidatus Bathyarchaeota archaeon]|nr:4-demethylwyosine synthase TYW1 [Candidatus Bathyarchaeota archaeon]